MSHPAAFYTSASPAAQPAKVTVTPEAILINLDGPSEQPEIIWPRATLRIEESSVSGGPLRVSSPTGEGLLMVSDNELLAAFGRRRKSGATALGQGCLIFAAIALGLILAGYYLLLPWIAGMLARRIPASLEQRMGRSAIEQLAPPAQRCEDENVRKPVRAIVDKLARGAPQMGYAFQVYIVNGKTVNALALPGGYIVVYSGLLEKTKSPEELAAVLAHEITHVTAHHATVGIMRAMTFWIMLSYLIGDPTGIVVQAAGAMSQLSYQRGQEEEADRGAMHLFEAAHIDPRGLERAFAMLGQEVPDVPASAKYFSTHPRTTDRLSEIRAWEKTAKYRVEPLLDGAAGAPWPPPLAGNCAAR